MMESLEAIRKMNGKHEPDSRRSRCIDDLCARVEALEKENKMLRDASENAHQPAPAPQDGPPEQTAAHDAPATAEARLEPLSVSSIRAIAARGGPVTSEQVARLCARVEQLEGAMRPLAEYAAAHYQQAAIAAEVGYDLPTDDDYPIEVPLGLLVALRRMLLS